MSLATQVTAVQTIMKTMSQPTIVDFVQLCGWFGAVSTNQSNGQVTVAGTQLTNFQYYQLGQALGICDCGG